MPVVGLPVVITFVATFIVDFLGCFPPSTFLSSSSYIVVFFPLFSGEVAFYMSFSKIRGPPIDRSCYRDILLGDISGKNVTKFIRGLLQKQDD